MNPRIRDKRKIHLACLQKRIKDNNKPAHWVGHSKLGSLDIYELFKITPNFDENQDIVTGNIEEEENAAENTTDDADENAMRLMYFLRRQGCARSRRRPECLLG